jgi:hypothetical protein
MPAIAHEVALAGGPASEGLQGRKPRSAGRALVERGAAMGIASGAGTRAMGAGAAAGTASAGAVGP